MKNRFFGLLALLLLAFSITAQVGDVLPPPKEIDKDYRKEYKEDLREWKKSNKEQEDDQWDIVIPPEEQIPVQQYDELPPASADNWGVRILLPGNLRDRMKAECQFPVVLKIADTGVELAHGDLQTNRLPGSNYTTSTTIDDEGGHGTHVYGIAMAKNFGLAWPLVEAGLLRGKSVKVLDKTSGSFTWYANAIATERTQDKALQESGVSVVWNSSLGGGTSDIAFVDAELKKSTDLGVTFVSAAGNSNGPVNYPGRSSYSITTASLDQNLLRSSYSCFGPQITASMPGRSITSTYLGNRYATLSGTSMASPFLAAATVIAKAKWGPSKLPNYTVTRDYLELVATDLGEEGFDDYYGAGINYITAILDTDPDELFDNPPPPPPPGDDEPGNPDPDPDPEPGNPESVTIEITSPIFFRYRTESEQRQGGTGTPVSWHAIAIDKLKLRATGSAGEAKTYDKMHELFQDYFYGLGKVMVVPDGDGPADVIRYVPMFFYYFTRQEGLEVFTMEVEGYDEGGRRYLHRLTDERKGGVPYPAESALPARVITYDIVR